MFIELAAYLYRMFILEICLSNWELKNKGILNRRQWFLWTAPSGFAFEARLLSCFQGNGVRDQSFSAFEDKFRIVTLESQPRQSVNHMIAPFRGSD